MAAILGGRAGVVEYLIGAGADVNYQRENGLTPLMVATRSFSYPPDWSVLKPI